MKSFKFGIPVIVFLVLTFFATHEALSLSRAEIDARVNATVKQFRSDVGEADELMKKAKGVLVLPKVMKAGLVIGGEYGEGALKINGKTVSYYSSTAASIGLQIGAQTKAVILLFMTDKALSQFRDSDGWEVGVDTSVAIASLGAGESLDSNTLKEPVIGFIFGNKGLMYNLTLEGTKITKIDK